MYEGKEPYLFISYAHADSKWIDRVSKLLEGKRIRYWYDDGLHFGDDWNLVLANHLVDAAACLLLLSPNSASSVFVKNEINFAISHGVPIYTLLLSTFRLPLDLDMMLGRLQMIEATGDFEDELIRSLPPELSMPREDEQPEPITQLIGTRSDGHPLYEISQPVMDRQGTVTYLGHHKTLRYQCIVQADPLKDEQTEEIWDQVVRACSVRHRLFPQIYDAVLKKDRLWSYQEYRGEQFLDQYLQQVQPSEKTILSWTNDLLDALETLQSQKLGLREFTRGSMVVLEDGRIGMFRLQNPYYGVKPIAPGRESVFLLSETIGIALLLAQFCLRKTPVMPVGIIASEQFAPLFLEKVNLVIQKCMDSGQYTSFDQIRQDLNAEKISSEGEEFLRQRAEKLKIYEQMRSTREQKFTFAGRASRARAGAETGNAEGKVKASAAPIGSGRSFSLRLCSTGAVQHFTQSSVTIGRSMDCDLILAQKSVSRHHARLENVDGEYRFYDLSPTNGSYISGEKVRTAPGEYVVVTKEDRIRIGTEEVVIL